MRATMHQPGAPWAGVDPRTRQERPSSHHQPEEHWPNRKFTMIYPPADPSTYVPSELIKILNFSPDAKASGPAHRSKDPNATANMSKTGGLHKSYTTSHKRLAELLPEASTLADVTKQPECFTKKPLAPFKPDQAEVPAPPTTASGHWKESKEDWNTQRLDGNEYNAQGDRANSGPYSNETCWPDSRVHHQEPFAPHPIHKATHDKTVPPIPKQRMVAVTNKVKNRERIQMQNMVEYLSARATKLVTMFRALDDNKDGAISRKEFDRLIVAVDPVATDDDCDKLFSRVDRNKDGSIVFDEFVQNLVNADVGGIPSDSKSAPRSKSALGKVKKSKAPSTIRSQSVMETGAKTMPQPKMFHGVGARAEMYDDGFLRTLVEGPRDKIWTDDRDWRKVRPPLTLSKTRYGCDHHTGHASSATLGAYYHDTSGLTVPLKGTPWACDGTEEWSRDCKQSYKTPIHRDLSMAKTMEQHSRLRSARLSNMWKRVQDVEAKCIAVNEQRLATFDARIDFIQQTRSRYFDLLAAEDAKVQRRLSKNGKKMVPPPSCVQANGYGTLRCLQPTADGHMVKRLPGMAGPRGIFPS